MIILGLGSNMGDRLGFLTQAVGALDEYLDDIRCSPIYEAAALLPKDAPEEWDQPFLNMVVAGQADIDAELLLAHVKSIEGMLGREHRGAWGPREIDVDILVMGNKQIETPGITIPHSQMLLRDFVLLPLADLLPQWCYPGPGKFNGMGAATIAKMQGFETGSQLRKTDMVVANG